MIDLSVIIPARNEQFLKRTVDDVLAKSEANTEVIVVSDGDWPLEPLDDDPRIILIKTSEPIGQRAAINVAARISTAKFIMKLDAHCILDQGFDQKLIADCEYDWTVIPRMYNLHAFNWRCGTCGNTWYQSPTPKFCCSDPDGKVKNENCNNQTSFIREMIWERRESRKNDFMRFDKDLHFQYWPQFKHRLEAQGDIADTMSLVGACFFMHRQRYWDLDGSDEGHGSWGQQGTEIACKTWLSGGRLVVNKKTWFAHLFRTQGGDFGFPYPNSGSAIDKARQHSKKMWEENKWPKAIHDLDWLIEKFKPVPGWHTPEKQSKLTKGIVYYTDNLADEKIATAVRKQLLKCMKSKHIVSVSLKPIDFGTNIVVEAERGFLTMARQILSGLEASHADVIFLCEHDVLYHPSHFDFLPDKDDIYYYNTNIWQVRSSDGHALYTDDCKKLSQLCAYRSTLITHFKKRILLMEAKLRETGGEDEDFRRFIRQMGFEPGSHNRTERVDDLKAMSRFSTQPNIDIRHDTNLTPTRFNKAQYKNEKYTRGWKEAGEVPGWGVTKDRMPEIMASI